MPAADRSAPRDLFEPLVFRGGARAPNRIALAPLTNQQSHEDGSLGDDELRWLARRAEGGFGIVETCAAHVTEDGQTWPGELGIFDDRLVPGLTRLAAALTAAGSCPLVQLFHGGARAPRALIGRSPLTASDAPEEDGAPRAATEEELHRIIDAFAAGAARARQAGFGGVELHGAHGYLLCQFLSRTQNRRDDAWGGPLAGRARLLREVTRRVRAATPPPFVVGVRLSPEDFGNAKGLDLDESLTVARWLDEDGVDFVHVSLWDCFKNSAKRPAEHPIPLFRAALSPDVPLFVAGKIWTRAEAESVLAMGADVIALGRAAIANPSWPREAKDPAFTPRRPPLTRSELRERALSDGFIDYMQRVHRFVDGE